MGRVLTSYLFCFLSLLLSYTRVGAYSAYENVRSYGAVGDGATDDLTAINNAISTVRAAGRGEIRFPTGNYAVSAAINAANLSNAFIVCEGPGSRVRPLSSGVHVIDLSGSSNVWIDGCNIDSQGNGTNQTSALFIARDSGGVAQGIHISRCIIDGNYTAATLYNFGVPDVRVLDSVLFNRYDAAPSYVAVVSATNVLSLTTATTVALSAALSAGGFGRFFLAGTELHHRGTSSNNHAPLWLEGVAVISMSAGNMSANSTAGASQYVKVSNSLSQAAFTAVEFFSDTGGSSVPQMVINVIDPGSVDGFTMEKCKMAAQSTLFQGSGGGVVNRLDLRENPTLAGPNLIAVASGGNLTLNNSYLEAAAKTINVGSGGIINRGLISQPGAITALSNTAQLLPPSGYSGGLNCLSPAGITVPCSPLAVLSLCGPLGVPRLLGSQWFCQ